MNTLARTRMSFYYIFVTIFITAVLLDTFATIVTATAIELTIEDETISNNCIGDIDDCHEAEMHPNVLKSNWEMKSQKEKTTDYWIQSGIQHVLNKIKSSKSNYESGIQTTPTHARNIIFFVGDGMSLATLAATRSYLGGEEQSLSFEKFPFTGLSRTYALDRLVPDSAAAATALFCGVKTQNRIIGLDGNAKRGDCNITTIRQTQLTSIAEWALNKGKWTGFVTTTRVTDATPAALYAHTTERSWENDVDLKKSCGANTEMEDIGLQLMNGGIGERFKVILGGGSAQLMPKMQHPSGLRTDGRHLINEFKTRNDNIFVTSKTDSNWLNANLSESGRFLGLFGEDHLPYHLEIENSDLKNVVPSLAEMTEKAIEILSENDDGYFLMVEAGKIDLAHHENKAKLAVDETAELGKAVAKALEMTNKSETLIVVTSDHGHTMSLAGYACRSNDIFGISDSYDDDDLPYKILSYANGPSYNGFSNDVKSKQHQSSNSNTKKHRIPQQQNNNENNKEDKQQENNFEVFPATVPLFAATHGGEDVPVFANGPWAYIFSGIYDQSTIPHLIAFAGCLDKDEKACHGI